MQLSQQNCVACVIYLNQFQNQTQAHTRSHLLSTLDEKTVVCILIKSLDHKHKFEIVNWNKAKSSEMQLVYVTNPIKCNKIKWCAKPKKTLALSRGEGEESEWGARSGLTF